MCKTLVALSVAAAFGATGCNTLTGADEGYRLLEYGGGGFVAPITGEAGGIAVHKWGDQAQEMAAVMCTKSGTRAAMVKVGEVSEGEVLAICGQIGGE